jgi:3-oxoadipate enol-lactonase
MPFLERPDGARLYYELHGSPSDTPLLLLEGIGGDIPGWRRNVPRLAAEHRVIAYDFRGNGRSEAPDELIRLPAFVQDTVALLDVLSIDRAHLYGQSFGGMVAMELALSCPARVRSLVLAATHAGAVRASKLGRGANVPKDRPYLALYSPRFAQEHPEHVADDIRHGARQPSRPRARRRQWQALRGWDAWDRIRTLRVPVLVLHGTEDRVIPVENGKRLAAAIPGSRLVLLEGAGHVYHSEQPEVADGAVLEFLREVDRRR